MPRPRASLWIADFQRKGFRVDSAVIWTLTDDSRPVSSSLPPMADASMSFDAHGALKFKFAFAWDHSKPHALHGKPEIKLDGNRQQRQYCWKQVLGEVG